MSIVKANISIQDLDRLLEPIQSISIYRYTIYQPFITTMPIDDSAGHPIQVLIVFMRA